MPHPKLSVCIPNYNNARYLRASVESAIDLDWDNKEIVVVDDGSSDDSIQILQSFSGISLYKSPKNSGQPAATNECISRSSGEYVVILHSDDWLLKNFAHELIPILERHPDVGLAAGERHETDEGGTPHPIAPLYDRDCIVPAEKQAKVFMFTSFLPCQVVVRRALLDAVGGVDRRHVVNLDGLLWFKCALLADVAYTRTPVCVYRRHAASTTAQVNRTGSHVEQYRNTLAAMFELARGRPYLERYFPAAEHRAGQLALRFAEQTTLDGDYSLARKYLSTAAELDHRLRSDKAFNALADCLASATDPRGSFLTSAGADKRARLTSYAPPDGARSID